LAFLERPDLVKTSTTGQGRDVGQGRSYNLDDLLSACWRTGQALARHVSTSDLNDEVAKAVLDYTPPMHQRRNVKLYFATQAENNPPLIVISANMGRCLTPAYERYLLRRLRLRWDLRGIPIRLVVRARGTGNKSRSAENAAKRSPRGVSPDASPAERRAATGRAARGAAASAEATPAKPPRRFGSAKRRAERGVR
jgi:GTP-binding protein